MTIAAYQPFQLFNQFHDEVNRLLNDEPNVTRTNNWSPAVDIAEQDTGFLLKVDLPGVSLEDISITAEENILTIEGKRESANDETVTEYKKIERITGTFNRQFRLPNTANAEGISASSRNGVLEVVIPKLEARQPRRIEVKPDVS